MKRFMCFFVIIILLFPVLVLAQTSIDSMIVQGKNLLQQANNSWQEKDMLFARNYFERLQQDETYPWLIHYYIAVADYRLTNFYLSNQNKEKAKNYLEDGIDHLELCSEIKHDFADAHSLLSSFYGNKIGLKPMLSLILGPKSNKQMSIAMSLDPQNPRNYLIAGISANYTPKMFGGGKDKALNHLKKAVSLFDSTAVENAILPDWGHDEAYAWFGQLQAEEKQFDDAEASYNKAIEINPDFGWVIYELKPQLAQKRMAVK